MVSIIDKALSSLRSTASRIVNDNEGWIRQGKFTPGQQIKSIQQQANQSPVVGVGPFVAPNWNNPTGKDMIKSFGKGFTNMSTFGLVQPKYEPQTPLGKYANVTGNVVGLVNPLNPLNKAMGALNVGGKAIAKLAPSIATKTAGKVIGGVGSELAQTAAYTGAQALAQKAGLKPNEDINLGTFGRNLAFGAAFRGVLSPQVSQKIAGAVRNRIPQIDPADQKVMEEFINYVRLRKKGSEPSLKLEEYASTIAEQYGLKMPKSTSGLADVFDDVLSRTRKQNQDWESMGLPKMGIKADATPQTGIVPQKGLGQKPLLQTIEGKLPTPALQTSRPPITAKENLKISKTLKNTPSTVSITPKGKLNVKNLNLSEEQKAAVAQVQDNVPVTVISNKEVVDQSRFTKGRAKALTDEEMKTRLAQQLNTRQEVVSLQRQYDKLKSQGAPEADLMALKSRIIDQARVSQQQGTFAGRLLQSQNILANEMATPEQRIYALLDNAGIKKESYLADAINVDFNDPKQVVEFFRRYVPPKFGEVLDEIRYTNMLSSPQTQIVNAASNVLQSGIVKPIEKTITGGLDWVKSKVTGSEREYYASQGIDYAKGYYSALPEAWQKFKNVVSGQEITLRPDLEYMPTGTKGPLKWYTTPLRMLEASDQFFRTLVESGERRSLARFKISEAEIAKRAAESADYTLFRQKFDPTGELGQGVVLRTWDKWNSVISMARRMPGGKWVLPFLQTPTNILKQGFEYSPLGVSTMIGAKRPLEQLSKALVGTGAFLTLYGLADAGQTTWDTPSNTKDKSLFYSAGMQPYSVKIGDNWVSYSKLGPLAYPLAMASAMKWVEKNNPDQNVVENLRDATAQMLGFFGDQSYVQNIGDLIEAIKGGTNVIGNAVSSEISNTTGQLVPYKSFLGWLTRMIDPVYRKPEGIVQDIKSGIPGMSQDIPAYTDIYGNESQRDYPVLNSFSPLKVSQEKPQAAGLYQSQEGYRIKTKQEKEIKDQLEQSGGATMTQDKVFYVDADGQVKTLDLGKVTSLPETTAYEKLNKQQQAFKLVDNVLENLPSDQQAQVLTKMGITPQQAQYYNIARQNDDLKYAYLQDEMTKIVNSGGSREQFLNILNQMRMGVNDKQIASNGVVDKLYYDGYITSQERKALKSIDTTGKIKASGSGRAKKITLKKIKAAKLPKLKLPKAKKLKVVKSKPIKFAKLKTKKIKA